MTTPPRTRSRYTRYLHRLRRGETLVVSGEARISRLGDPRTLVVLAAKGSVVYVEQTQEERKSD